MNKKDIINKLNQYGFDKNKYVVISGAAMVLLGIKETTNDIDIAVSNNYYYYLLKNYNCVFERKNEYNEDVYYIDNIINFSRTYYNKNNLYIENIPIQNHNQIIALKQKLNRTKDLIDIKKIKEYYNE